MPMLRLLEMIKTSLRNLCQFVLELKLNKAMMVIKIILSYPRAFLNITDLKLSLDVKTMNKIASKYETIFRSVNSMDPA